VSVGTLAIIWALTALILLACQVANLYAWWQHHQVHRMEREIDRLARQTRGDPLARLEELERFRTRLEQLLRIPHLEDE